MFDWISGTMASMGEIGVALLMLLENVFPPIPSELIMPLAGFISERGGLSFWPVVAAGSAGSLAGALAWYWVGRSVGERRFRVWVDAHGRWLTLSCEDLDRAKGWFDRHGGAAVFIGRLIPGIRTFISVPAGFAEMPFAPFLAYSTAGTALWTAALAIAGRMLGSQYDQVSTYLGPISWIVLGGILVLYVYRVVKWRRSSSVEDDQESQAVSA
jgi:membrane protein DedA with SNARE-associated domain